MESEACSRRRCKVLKKRFCDLPGRASELRQAEDAANGHPSLALAAWRRLPPRFGQISSSLCFTLLFCRLILSDRSLPPAQGLLHENSVGVHDTAQIVQRITNCTHHGLCTKKLVFCCRLQSRRRLHLSVSGWQDSLGNTPWRINGRILALMREVQKRDLGIAEVPPNTDPQVAPLADMPMERERLKMQSMFSHRPPSGTQGFA